VLVQARLAPDMYPLVKQVQSACDTAKYTAAYLSGQAPPAHPDTETTLAELHARIETVLGYLETFKASDFEGWQDRKVSPSWLGGKWMRAGDYALQTAWPNFYFHTGMAYAILRHNGVDVGKMDFLGSMPIQG
jgi:uncharacterized protein